MNSSSSATSGPIANAESSLKVDLRWLLDELLADGWIDQNAVNLVSSTPRTKEQLHWHPLQVIAEQNLKHLQSAAELDLDRLTEWLAAKANVPNYHIDPLKVDVPAVTAVMSYAFADRHQILAVEVGNDEVVIATSQPFYNDWRQGLSQVIRDKVFTQVVVNPKDLHKFTIEFYNLARSVSHASGESTPGAAGVTNFEQLLEIGELTSADANDQHIVNIVDWLLQYAFNQRASDIHLEPRRDKGFIRFRIDGVLHDVYELPAVVMAAVTSRIKILGRMNVAEKRRPQDGRLKTKTPDAGEIELRLSTLPTAFGEKLVMRIFDPDVLVRTYQELGLANEDFEKWQSMVGRPHGIILVTGPTGSGKTTTLYTTLKQLSTREVNVCTIEDPIEMVEPSFNQVQVQPQIEVTFAEGVKSLLRQDPDIIMVGEIRDLETAEMAVQASLTGHLVISTLHTNDAPSAVTRLVDLGVAPYLISATVLGIMAQRLVRTLCPHCKRPAEVDLDAWAELTAPWKASPPKQVYEPVGCLECRDTGYLGRMGVYEMFMISNKLKELIGKNAPLEQLRREAYKNGMHSLRISGAQKVANGLTTIEEVLRVTPPPDAI